MKCIIVDDEPLAVDIITSFVEKVPHLELCASTNNALEAIELIAKHNADLIFLDIQMPNLSGIELVKTLNNPPLIIFTTAYSNYALDGFELNAVDYLLKPIPFDRFIKAVNKAMELFRLRNATSNQKVQKESEPEPDFIMVKADYSMVRVGLDQILYIEGLKDYLKIVLANGKPILTLNSLKNYEERLPQSQFIRVHRSYIVAVNKIESIQKHRIVIGKDRIPIGDNFKEAFYQRMDKNNIF
ncbi:MAG: LytR/AlgR family response regulator transcription factor [Salinivirgaceae bacterium]